MKKYLALLAVLVLMLGLCACGGDAPETSVPESSAAATTLPATEPTTVPTTVPVSDPTTVGGVDLSALSLEEATAALNEAAASYQLALSVNGKNLTISAAEIGLTLDETALQQYINAVCNGQGGEVPEALFTYDRELLKGRLSGGLNTAPVNATISYSGSTKQFEVKDGSNGTQIDADAAANAAADALGMLKPDTSADVEVTEVAPEIAASSEKVTNALNKANGYLKVSLTYTYSPEGGTSNKVTIDTATLAGFINVSDTLEVSVSKSAIESYAEKMASSYAGGDYKGSFVTTGGSTLGYTVTYYGQKVDKSALTNDIYKCITEQKSGTRTAPYSAKSSKPYGGSYVEVDLSSQKLWLYKNGERVVSTSLVSGCVAEGHCTPTGIYSIYAKQTDRYLTGADYRSFVHYWMPFLGGYGLHDASWRSSFGGTIYHYNGSHGCVNLPSSAAKKIYNNVSVGTKVILYGGKREVADMVQKLTGTTSYTLKADAAPFKLDAKAKYTGDDLKITYVSSNTGVVTVSADGTVTVKGPGTATITVKAAAFEFYTAAELKINITVQESDATKPTESEPTEPKPTESEPTEPKPTEPKPTEPKPTEPKPTEPKPTEPKPTEPKPTEPKPTEPKPTEPKPTEPKPTEPKPTEPKPTEPKPTEPKPTEPKPTDPESTEPAE